MKNVKLKKNIIAIVMLFSFVTTLLQPDVVYATRGEYDKENVDTDSTYKTSGKLVVKTHLIIETPINPFARDDIRSKGSSKTKFSKKDHNEVQRTFKSHTIVAKVTGIGGASFSKDGLDIKEDGNTATISCDTYKWNYKIYADIYRVYGYRERHSVSYVLSKPTKSGNHTTRTTVTMSSQIKYGF